MIPSSACPPWQADASPALPLIYATQAGCYTTSGDTTGCVPRVGRCLSIFAAKHVPAKEGWWTPVRVAKMRQTKSRARSDPIGTEKALVLALGEAFQKELLGIGFGVAKFLQRTKAALEHSGIALGPEHPIRRFLKL